MSNYQQLRLSSLLHLHENVFLIVFTLAPKHEKALTEALKHTDQRKLSACTLDNPIFKCGSLPFILNYQLKSNLRLIIRATDTSCNLRVLLRLNEG